MNHLLAAILGLVLGVVVAEAVILTLALVVGLSGSGMDVFAFVWGIACGFGGVMFAVNRWAA